MLRTPYKTALFLLLITLSVTLSVVGLALWLNASSNLEKAEEAFVTIGTVQQKENTMLTESIWDGNLESYVYRNTPVYDAYIPLETLLMDGVEYISGPEQRPFYGGYVYDLIVREEEMISAVAVIEFMPVSDCIPSEPVEVEVVNAFYGNDFSGNDLQGQYIQFYDRYTRDPALLESGKTYIASIWFDHYNDGQYENMDMYETIYAPHTIYSGQSATWEEVNEGFYETAEGEMWFNYVNALDRFMYKTVPVTPTNDTQLLSAFHNGDAAIAEGRDINAEEYETGANVCLISQNFAALNDLALGDTVKIGLYNSNYGSTAIEVFGYGYFAIGGDVLLNSDGDFYNVFEESGYRIVGICKYPYTGGIPSGYELSPNEIIVPMNSITNSDENNIVATGPMQGKNTSFRIANGASEEFMEAFSKLPESSLLEIQFYDNGYEAFAAGFQNASLFGMVLFWVGLAASVAVICLILYFYIIKQRKRTAVERALGMKKRQCIASLMIGILILTALGTAAGCIVGATIGNVVQDRVLSEGSYFSEQYTRGLVNQSTNEIAMNTDIESLRSVSLYAFVVMGMVLFVFLLSWILIHANLRISPIYLLNSKSKE